VLIDLAVVTVAHPAIQRALGGGLALQQWVVDAYLLTLGSLILLGGSLGDRFAKPQDARHRAACLRLGLDPPCACLERRRADRHSRPAGHRRCPCHLGGARDDHRDFEGRGAWRGAAIGSSTAGIASGINNTVARIAGLLRIAIVGPTVAGRTNRLDAGEFHTSMAIAAVLLAPGGAIGLVGIRNPAAPGEEFSGG